MASNYDITMRQFNGIDYDTLYPKTILSQIGDLANYAQINSSGLYLPNGAKSGGILDMNGNRITNIANPVNNNDAVNKSYVDSIASGDWVLQGTLNTTFFTSGSVELSNLNTTRYVKEMKIIGTIRTKKTTRLVCKVYIPYLGLNLAYFRNTADQTAEINCIVPIYNFYEIKPGPSYVLNRSLVGYIGSSSDSETNISDKLYIKTNQDDNTNITVNLNVYYKFYD